MSVSDLTGVTEVITVHGAWGIIHGTVITVRGMVTTVLITGIIILITVTVLTDIIPLTDMVTEWDITAIMADLPIREAVQTVVSGIL